MPSLVTKRIKDLIDTRVPAEDKGWFIGLLNEELSGVPREQRILSRYKRKPVGIREFIESTSYLRESMDNPVPVYPAVMEELEEINTGKYTEVVFTGGIGSGKSTAAIYTTVYQIYLLSCLKDPHRVLNLDRASEIMFIVQNKTLSAAISVDYSRMRMLVDRSPYFKKYFSPDPNLKNEMVFPNRIIVRPVGGSDSAAIGQNVFGGLIDELNFMDTVKDSKRAIGGDGGEYDQAVSLYNSLASRRESRFLELGKVPGILCLVSSRRYPGQFTDTKEEEAKTNPRIYVYDKRTWDVKPDTYSGEVFYVFTGTLSKQPRILEQGEKVLPTERHRVIPVPIEERPAFEREIYTALRDRAGLSTRASFPFFTSVESVAAAFGRTNSILSSSTINFSTEKLHIILKHIRNPSIPRWVHIDLGVTSDCAGVACGYVPGFAKIKSEDDDGIVVETLPNICYDFLLRVVPPVNGEISFSKIRKLLYALMNAGVNIQWVSFDSYESRDSIQILRTRGLGTGIISLDKDPIGYDYLKGAFYDKRLFSPKDDFVQNEILSLEKNAKSGKVDHPPNGSKDVADAMAGVARGLTTMRAVWMYHGVPPYEIPERIKALSVKTEASIKDKEDVPM